LASSLIRSFGSGFYFSLWDYVKAKVYETHLASITDLDGVLWKRVVTFLQSWVQECRRSDGSVGSNLKNVILKSWLLQKSLHLPKNISIYVLKKLYASVIIYLIWSYACSTSFGNYTSTWEMWLLETLIHTNKWVIIRSINYELNWLFSILCKILT